MKQANAKAQTLKNRFLLIPNSQEENCPKAIHRVNAEYHPEEFSEIFFLRKTPSGVLGSGERKPNSPEGEEVIY